MGTQGMRLQSRAERDAGQGPAGGRSTNAFVRRRADALVAGTRNSFLGCKLLCWVLGGGVLMCALYPDPS